MMGCKQSVRLNMRLSLGAMSAAVGAVSEDGGVVRKRCPPPCNPT